MIFKKFYVNLKIECAIIVTVCFVLTIGVLCGFSKADETNRQSQAQTQSKVIYDADGLTVWLYHGLDGRTCEPCYYVKVQNETQKDVTVYMKRIVANGTIQSNRYFYASAKSGEFGYSSMSGVIADIRYAGAAQIDALAFDLSFYGYEPPESADLSITMDLSDMTYEALIWDCYLGARALAQTIVDQDDILVELLNLGFLYSDDSYKNDFQGILRFTNKSDKKIPIGLDGVRINGISFDERAGMSYLEPGFSTIIQFDVYSGDIEKAGIDAISEVSLLVLTSEDELTGTVNLDGGTWYPIELSEMSDIEATRIDGDLVFDHEGIQIYYVGMDETIYSWGNGLEGYYSWNYYVVNDTDRNIDLHISELYVDGVLQKDYDWDGNYLFMGSEEIGSHSMRKVEADYHFKDGADRPDIGIVPEIRTLGGGSIIYKSDEVLYMKAQSSGEK